MSPRGRKLLAWSLWLASLGCCAAGLMAALLWIRPLTLGLLARGAGTALTFPFGYATIGLVLTLRRPANPIGWLYAASGLIWSLTIPFEPWLDQLGRDHRPLALAARLAVVAGEIIWAPAIACGITLPFLLLPDGRLRSRRWRLVVAAAGRLAAGAGNLAVAAATLAAVAASAPLRRRVQRLVDRRCNRRRYDAEGTVAGFAARLREQVDLDALAAELLAVVDQTVQPTTASLWLRPPAGQRPRG